MAIVLSPDGTTDVLVVISKLAPILGQPYYIGCFPITDRPVKISLTQNIILLSSNKNNNKFTENKRPMGLNALT